MPLEGAIQETVTESLSLLLLWVIAVCNGMVKFNSILSDSYMNQGPSCYIGSPSLCVVLVLTVEYFLSRTLDIYYCMSEVLQHFQEEGSQRYPQSSI